MRAISDERLLCERCAIVDIDVHHGNGTEEIVRYCNNPEKLFFFSIHVYDNKRKGKRETKLFQYKFYPGTGDKDGGFGAGGLCVDDSEDFGNCRH